MFTGHMGVATFQMVINTQSQIDFVITGDGFLFY